MLIAEYQPEWQEDFNRIKEALTKVLSSSDLTIEHIGSTSVKGLATKPIIDIDLVYHETSQLNTIIQELESVGYVHVGDQGIVGREVFKRTKPHQNHRVLDFVSHHLYACCFNNNELKRHLTFRDYLRKNKDARTKYENLKLDIAKQANQDKKKYAILKEEQAKDFIEYILTKATQTKTQRATDDTTLL